MNSKVAQRIIHYVRSDKVRRAAHLTSYFRLRKHVPNSIGMRHLKHEVHDSASAVKKLRVESLEGIHLEFRGQQTATPI